MGSWVPNSTISNLAKTFVGGFLFEEILRDSMCTPNQVTLKTLMPTQDLSHKELSEAPISSLDEQQAV